MARKLDPRILTIERDSDGVWIYLKPGFVVRDERTHAIVEDTKTAALDKLALVEPCACAECTRNLTIIANQKVFS